MDGKGHENNSANTSVIFPSMKRCHLFVCFRPPADIVGLHSFRTRSTSRGFCAPLATNIEFGRDNLGWQH